MTGSACLIGGAIAMRVVHDGSAVVVNYAGSTAKIDGAVDEINGASHF